jgi:hypothetical protein
VNPPQTTFTADAIIDAKILEMQQFGFHRTDGFRHLQGLFQEMLAVAPFYGSAHNPQDFHAYIVIHKYSLAIFAQKTASDSVRWCPAALAVVICIVIVKETFRSEETFCYNHLCPHPFIGPRFNPIEFKSACRYLTGEIA